MRNENLYRSAGVCGLLSIVLMLAELPLYILRGPIPSQEAASLIAYATHNAWNMLATVLMDVVICALLLIFLDGFRRMIGNTQPDSMWIATQVFGAGVVYSAVTLFGDALQAASAVNALGQARSLFPSRIPAGPLPLLRHRRTALLRPPSGGWKSHRPGPSRLPARDDLDRVHRRMSVPGPRSLCHGERPATVLSDYQLRSLGRACGDRNPRCRPMDDHRCDPDDPATRAAAFWPVILTVRVF